MKEKTLKKIKEKKQHDGQTKVTNQNMGLKQSKDSANVINWEDDSRELGLRQQWHSHL